MAGEYERVRSLAASGLTPQRYSSQPTYSYKNADDRRHNVLLQVKDGQLVDSNGNNYTQSALDESQVPVIIGKAPRNTSQYYDPNGALSFAGAVTSPFNFVSPSNWVGTARRVMNEGLNYNTVMDSFMNLNNKGVVTENFYKNHPIWSTVTNLGFDVLTGASASKLGGKSNIPVVNGSDVSAERKLAKKTADFYLEGDPYEIYIQRAKAKGATDDQINAILQTNVNTKEGRAKLAEHLYQLDKKAGKVGAWEDPDLVKAEELKLFNKRVKNSGNWDNIGSAVPDLKTVHYDYNQLPTISDESFVRLHELEHALHYPARPVPEGSVALEEFTIDPAYWTNHNNTEIGARISQILSFLGIKDGRKITGDQLRRGFDQYLATGQHDNSIFTLNRRVKDWDALAKWANDPANVFGTAATVGISLPMITNNGNGKTVKAN